ncbi:hypothetical protein DMJ13_16850 [halophilic archaeon]|nr:hypothetical protein DMJ13_16850 [halophilic archaeon]
MTGENAGIRDDGALVVEPDGDQCGVWVAHFAGDPDSDAVEIGNVWGDTRRMQVTVPKAAVEDLVAALERRT